MEHVFYFELVRELPRLKDLKLALDESTFSALIEKTKHQIDTHLNFQREQVISDFLHMVGGAMHEKAHQDDILSGAITTEYFTSFI